MTSMQNGLDDVALLKRARADMEALREAICKVVVGQPMVVRPLLAAVLAEGHVLLIGVPGLAKTLLVKTLAQTLSWSFKRVQFTPDMMPADIVGMEVITRMEGGMGGAGHGLTPGVPTTFVPGPVFANLVLADEINRAPPKTQSALLEAMQEYTVTSLGRGYPLDRPFVVVATQNPIEHEGTYPLPEAQLDRFMAGIHLDYPPVADEEAMVAATTAAPLGTPAPVVSVAALREYQALVRRMPMATSVVSYAVGLARATRPTKDADEYVRKHVEWGAGPRASQHLALAAKALAVIDGRPFASSEHVKEAAAWVLRHRMLLSFEAAAAGIEAQEIVAHVVGVVKKGE